MNCDFERKNQRTTAELVERRIGKVKDYGLILRGHYCIL